jgi:type I restriction enzyme S subunit
LDDDASLAPEPVTYEERPSRADLTVRPGDVCFARMQGTEKILEFDVDHADLILSTGFAVLRPMPDKLHSGFLRHWLHTREFQSSKDRLCSGATQKAITNEKIEQLTIPLPGLDEQGRIAGVLDRTEALQAKRRAALAQLNTLTEAVSLDMFGDAEAREWPMATVAELAHPSPGSIRTGPFGSQLLHGEFIDQGVAVLGIDNAVENEFSWGKRRFISEAKYGELRRYTVQPGDVLITIMGTCGRCAIVPDDIPVAINTKHLCCITLDQDKCLPAFLHAYFLRHPLARRYLERTAKGAIMAGLNMAIIKAMPIPVPPLNLQDEFAQRVGAIETFKKTHRLSLANLDALFASLQQRAFRGAL